MKAPQNLRRPANWQDFESLCKKLWGEIWKCPEIQKNGRPGQEQQGVDLFGMPFGEDDYYGIQCKGKSEYTHSQFTTEEIEKEIENAKLFRPPLKKYYLTTTALNDVKIQEFVREKNIEHKKNNLFEVHVFGWESIVDLIEENRETFDYYVNSQNYKTSKSVSVTFRDGTTEITRTPKFKQNITIYELEGTAVAGDYISPGMLAAIESHQKMQRLASSLTMTSTFGTKINHSFFDFDIRITNTGTEPIEDYELLFNFEGGITEQADTNEDNSGSLTGILVRSKSIPTTYLRSDSFGGKFVPRKSILVGDATVRTNDIYIKPTPEEGKIFVKWKLISKHFKTEGELAINVIPEIEVKRKVIRVEDSSDVKIVREEAKDYIEQKKEK